MSSSVYSTTWYFVFYLGEELAAPDDLPPVVQDPLAPGSWQQGLGTVATISHVSMRGREGRRGKEGCHFQLSL
jgi:hypothetical protein